MVCVSFAEEPYFGNETDVNPVVITLQLSEADTAIASGIWVELTTQSSGATGEHALHKDLYVVM